VITEDQKAAIAAKVESMELAVGVGNEVSACSIAAINLALTGKLTDDIPDCMSPVIGQWIIGVQDRMPTELRNSAGWKSLLPLAAGTGRAHEKERLALIMDWMWGTVLPAMQEVADRGGYGPEWSRMTTERSHDAAWAATRAAGAAYRATRAAGAAYRAAMVAGAAYRAAMVARAAAYAADGAWQVFDPVGLLERLINVGGGE
jgi:hypothetical protein